MTPSERIRPKTRLVVHDICMELEPQSEEPDKLQVYVECKRRKCKVSVDECRACERLDRIDSHEAGFVVLCRAEDESFEPSGG